MLLMLLMAIPLIGVIISLFIRSRSINMPLIASGIVLVLGGFGLKNVFEGVPLSCKIPLSGPFLPSFELLPYPPSS